MTEKRLAIAGVVFSVAFLATGFILSGWLAVVTLTGAAVQNWRTDRVEL